MALTGTNATVTEAWETGDDWTFHLAGWRLLLGRGGANRAEATIVNYERATRQFRTFLRNKGLDIGPESVTGEHVRMWMVEMAEQGLAPGTMGLRLHCLRQFFKYLREDADLPVEDPTVKVRTPKGTERVPAVITPEEMKALLKACGKDILGLRDKAILLVLWSSGMRIGEAMSLQVDSIDFETGIVKIMGKGSRERYTRVGEAARVALMAYLGARRKHGLMDKAMWISRNKTPLSRGQGWRLVKVAGLRAGIPDLHPHRFRHSFGHNWMMAGGNETDLMKVAGWKSQRMVARYGQSAAAERALAAHERLGMGDGL